MTRRPLYLLDTCVVSDLRRPRPDPAMLEWMRDKPADTLAIAWSTVFEIQYGAELARPIHPDHAGGLEDWLEGYVLSGRFRIIRPNAASVRLRARMHATPGLRRFIDARPGAKRPANGEDLTIAATAIAAGAVVVTMDERDFAAIHRHFPLPGVVNPRTGNWTSMPPPDTTGTSPYADPSDENPGAQARPWQGRRWAEVMRAPESWLAIALQRGFDGAFAA